MLRLYPRCVLLVGMSESNKQQCRQPVIAIVGHIDHGKTTLLDYIRKSAVALGETGGITQRVSAYEVEHPTPEGERSITFIDTPGHEAFQKMRARGAAAADIAILVVAADDGVKPQTIEAYKAVKDAGIPFIVAFTKIDKENANIERAKESVAKHEIYLEGLGGDVPFVGVSGKTGAGVSELLDIILLVADVKGIQCDPAGEAEAVVIESSRDPKSGVSATALIKNGTIKTGGFAVAGVAFAPLRSIEDFTGKKVAELCCGKPVVITGFTEEPPVGTILSVVKSKKEAEALAKEHAAPPKERGSSRSAENAENGVLVRLLIKADTAGSLEALEYELRKIPQEKVRVLTVSSGIGAISENDIKILIGFSPAFAVGFGVKVEPAAKDLAERNNIVVETNSIIYELADWLKEKLKTLEPSSPLDAVLGEALIVRHFSTAGSKHVVGGKVGKGVLAVGNRVTIVRRGVEVGTGKVLNLQSQKADVSSVAEGKEFGAQIETKADVIGGDTLTATAMPHKK